MDYAGAPHPGKANFKSTKPPNSTPRIYVIEGWFIAERSTLHQYSSGSLQLNGAFAQFFPLPLICGHLEEMSSALINFELQNKVRTNVCFIHYLQRKNWFKANLYYRKNLMC